MTSRGSHEASSIVLPLLPMAYGTATMAGNSPGLANALEAKEPCHQSRARTPEAPCLTNLALLAQQPA
jgi:hypothetical protein